MPLLKARHRPPSTSPADSAVGGIASTVAQKPTAGLPTTTTLRDPTYMSEWSTASKRSWHHLASTSLESSPKLTSSSSESSNSELGPVVRQQQTKTEGQATPVTPSLRGRPQLSSGPGFPLHFMRPDPGQAGNPEDKKR